jgi:hypothetical protein
MALFCLKALYRSHGSNEGNFEVPQKKKVSRRQVVYRKRYSSKKAI